MKQDYFETTDLGCAAGMLARRVSVVSLDTSDAARVVFRFENTAEVRGLAEDYFNGKLSVDASTYWNCSKNLKSMLYNLR